MAINSIAPGFVKISYTTVTRPHIATIPCDFDSSPVPGTEPNLATKSGGSVLFSAAMDAWIDLIKPLHNAETAFTLAEVWSVPTVGADPIFIYAHPLSEVGTGAAATNPNSQLVISFRSGGGGILKIYLMEVVTGLFQRDAFPFSNTTMAAIGTFVTGSSSWVLARDNSYAVSPLRATTKINDALRKKYLLNE